MTRRRAYELQGELGSFPPPVLFQMMALGNLSGVLSMRSPAGACEVFFQHGRLVFARDAGSRESIGEELVRRGLLQKVDCESAARERERHPEGPRIGAILVQRGKMQRQALEDLIRDRIKDVIYRVVDWRQGRFTFELNLAPEDEDILLDVQLESLLLECMTRHDEVRRSSEARADRG